LTHRGVKPIKFKKNATKTVPSNLSSTFEKKSVETKPQNMNDILEALNLMLKNIGTSMENFCQFVENPT
jgi:hypothetical protein